MQLHLVMDNYGTHKQPQVRAWLKKHPRFVCHFIRGLPPGLTFATNGTLSGTPTSAGSFAIMVTVTDHSLATVTKPFNIVVYLASSVLL
jgi:hypothetical protein